MKLHFNSFAFSMIALLYTQAAFLQAQTVGLLEYDPELAAEGYVLMAPLPSHDTYLLDNCGRVMHVWEGDDRPGNSVYLQEDGSIIRTQKDLGDTDFEGGGIGGEIVKIAWDGTQEWKVDYSTPAYHQHHDIEVLPNGNILILAWELVSEAEALQMGRDPAILTEAGIWPEKIVEIQPNAGDDFEEVWSWHVKDHLIQDFDPTKDNYGVVEEHPELMDINYTANTGANAASADWLHANSVAYNADLDQIVISLRAIDEIWVIDHSTTTEEAAGGTGGNSGMGGNILYRWGNPQAYNTGTEQDVKLFGQHDARWIPEGYPDEGKIMIFNNGQGRPEGGYSSSDVIDPPLNSMGTYDLFPGQAYGPDELSWTYPEEPDFDLYSPNISGSERLWNGNTIFCEGNQGHLLEVTYEGEIVWEYVSPVQNGNILSQGQTPEQNPVFRYNKYPLDHPAFALLELPDDPQPVELDPLQSDCEVPVSTDDLDEADLLSETDYVLWQQTSDDILRLDFKTYDIKQIHFYDLQGRCVHQGLSAYSLYENIDIRQWQAGVYLMVVQGDRTPITKKVSIF